MKLVKWLVGLALAAVLAACGGGGGSPGNTANGGTSPGSSSPIASTTGGTLTLSLTRADGSVVSGGRLSQTEDLFLSALVIDSAGKPVGGARVEFSLDSTEAKLVPSNGVALTNLSSGVASIKVAPASVSAQGVVTASAKATLNGATLAKDLYLDIAPGLVQLANLRLSSSNLQQGQSLVASVDVLVNGIQAPSNSVAINFSSACGDVSPSSAIVDGSGVATTVLQTTQVGNCLVAASYNAVSLQQPFVVSAPPITSIQFVSVSPEKIYQSGSPGVTQAIVKFKLINSVGGAVSSIPVTGTLTNVDGNINFCGSPYTSLPTNGDGEVEFSVCSGTLPATVQVKASLDMDTKTFALSNLLTIQTGLPTQRFFDISATQLNFWAGGLFTNKFNGNEVEISVFAADRQGNPIPQGTNIVFVSEGGQLITSGNSSCTINSTGRCSVKLVGQDYRPLGSSVVGADPRPGRVTVLAYTDGEESFIDKNNNNRYDVGELFEDLGLHFIDKDEDGVLTPSYTNLVVGTNEGESNYPLPDGAFGSLACPSNVAFGLSRQNTCNGVWDAITKVRRSIVIVFSGDEIGQPSQYDPSIPLDKRTEVLSITRGKAVVRIADRNGNPMPASAGISTEVLGGGSCTAKLQGASIGNSTEPTEHEIIFDLCGGGERVLVKTQVQSKVSTFEITVP